MLSTATVMIGARDKLNELGMADSVGLVKNFTFESTPEFTELTQGVTNEVVFALKTSNPIRCTFEMYEYTEANLQIALGLAGAKLAPITGDAYKLTAASTAGADETTLTVDDPASPQALSPGDSVALVGLDGNVTLAKVKTAPSMNSMTIEGTWTNQFASGTIVRKVNVLDLGSNETDITEYAVKAVGKLADGTIATFLFSRCRVTSGLQMAFSTDNFGNIPFEFTPMAVLNDVDDPGYPDFIGCKGKLLLS
ncbi:hypothetical protein PU634_10310 [Oceanimonas pelagia]|uniref:Uncharacterized protein n=1 Tax=Oceanimonas pelagia TaxID=3028314 RepID=A0AA50KL43_9GAMM|nr:hypothetical protein [Oceanimonas pelagia]WMC09508.1 hypothetical protein PU634_10310 [Oceanimonas pelagia]